MKEVNEAFVWVWLPGETQPVVAGRLEARGDLVEFNYGRSYLEAAQDLARVSLYEPELPMQPGRLPLLDGLTMPGCIRDAAPDAWGRRVILNKRFGRQGLGSDTAILDEITYLLESGSDRIGALDFQRSASVYEPRSANNVGLEELVQSASRVEQGVPLTPELDQALFHGSSIGGARPKALIQDQGIKYVAKFSSSTDLYSVVKAEFVAMRLAKLSGLQVAPVRLVGAAGKDVLLIERFDRVKMRGEAAWSRKMMVSALTLFGLDDMLARYASYEQFAQIIRHSFTQPKETLRELFSRLVFNVLTGNTDDHARNHAAFWDGKALSLTPAYDICPQGRSGFEASQAMGIVGDNKLSQLKACRAAAPYFLLQDAQAMRICDEITSSIETHWQTVCEQAQLSEVDKAFLWGRQFLNPFSLIKD